METVEIRTGIDGQQYAVDEWGNPMHEYVESTDGETWSERHAMGCAICGESEAGHYDETEL